MWADKDWRLDLEKRGNPSNFLVLLKEDVPHYAKQRLIEIAGLAGYISNLLQFIGDEDVDISLQNEIVKITGERGRNFDLVYLLKRRKMSALVKKTIEETLFSNVRVACEKGYLSEIQFFLEDPSVPDIVKVNARNMLDSSIENAIKRGFYLGFPKLLGAEYVSESLQLKAFDHWEKGRAADFDLELLLKRNNLYKSLKMKIVDALFRRGATSRIPQKLKFKKLKQDKEQEKGELLSIKDFHDPKKRKIKGPKIRNIQIRIRRRNVC
jgi:hypothetical protein